MNNIRNLAAVALLTISLLMLASVPASASVVLSATPTTIGAGTGAPGVQQVTIRVIPGYCGKVFIGGAAMNTTTYANTYKVLYPNCSGGFSEEWTLTDLSGKDGIDLNTVYIAGQIPGERVLVEKFATGIAASGTLTAVVSGPAKTSLPAMLPITSYMSAMVHITVIPGMVGKIRVGNSFGPAQPDAFYTSERKMLYPNTGNTSQNNAHSEEYWLKWPGGVNGYDSGNLGIWREVSGEYPLVTVWQRI